jgi:outer membrane receptor for ferrienterochelin and colicins
MQVPHYAGYIEKDRMETTQRFFDLNFAVNYDFKLSKSNTLQLKLGVNNLFNSFQKDFDKGMDRDSGYIYGPTMPRTYYIGLKLKM